MYVLNSFVLRKRRVISPRMALTLGGVAFVVMLFYHLSLSHTNDVLYNRRTLQYQHSTMEAKPVGDENNRKRFFWGWFSLRTSKVYPIDLWEKKKDLHEFEYIHNSRYRCYDLSNKTSDIHLVIFVNSAPKNAKKRAYIRKTFGNASAWPTSDKSASVMRIVFLIARTKDPEVQQDIHFESLMHNDIVQENFIDDYLNMTRKTVMGMKWVTKYCRHAKYTMKIDDDILLNVKRILEIISLAPRTNFAYGTVHWAKPVRTFKRGPMRKFYTPHRVFPGKEYPPYLNGHAYLMSTDVVEKIYHVAMEIDLFPWSDVFIGMCMGKLGIRLRHSSLFVSYGFDKTKKLTLETKENSVDIMREYVTIFHQPEVIMDQVWAIWTNNTL